MGQLQNKLTAQKSADEQQRLRKIQQEMDMEKRRNEEEEKKKVEEEASKKMWVQILSSFLFITYYT